LPAASVSGLIYSGAPMASEGRLTTVSEDRNAAGRSPSSCAWCNALLDRSAARLAGRTRCASCGAATTDPWPTGDELERAYAGYRPASGRFSGVGDRVLRVTRARLANRIDRLAPSGPVLDVGAGDGTLLDALRSRGRDGLGLERDPRRDDVRESDVTELEENWSAIVFWHSLEHLPAPGQAIDHAARHLRPGGALFVALPNTASLQANVFGDRWFHLDLPRHLVHLSGETLTERVRSLGLEVTRVSHWRGGQALFGWLHGLVGTLPGRLDLYDAIRRPEARSRPLPPHRRALTLGAALALFPAAALATAVETAARRGGTVYVEARRG
jgi:SAM-dependent methyltransferase